MSKVSVKITMKTDISTDGKYCDTTRLEMCAYIHSAFSERPRCDLFNKALKTCLGGGPLRCDDCLEAERHTKEVNP